MRTFLLFDQVLLCYMMRGWLLYIIGDRSDESLNYVGGIMDQGVRCPIIERDNPDSVFIYGT